MTNRNEAILRISNACLVNLLKLPSDTKIIGVSGDMFFGTDETAIKVSHPELPNAAMVCRQDGAFPTLIPTLTPRQTFDALEWADRENKITLARKPEDHGWASAEDIAASRDPRNQEAASKVL